MRRNNLGSLLCLLDADSALQTASGEATAPVLFNLGQSSNQNKVLIPQGLPQ